MPRRRSGSLVDLARAALAEPSNKDAESRQAMSTRSKWRGKGKPEMVFVRIRPGEYAWRCRGFEGKGMTGKFIVK
jgi:plastocyanin